jgi:hypothetical protein
MSHFRRRSSTLVAMQIRNITNSINKTGNVVQQCVAFTKPSIIYFCVCVCICVCGGGARARACACTRVALLIIQHAKRRHIAICRLSSSPSISTLSHERYDFRKKLLNIKCVVWFFLQLLFRTFLILRGNKRDIILNVKTSSCKVPGILVGFKKKIHFSRQVFEKSSNITFYQNMSNGNRIVQWEERTDGRTWRS